MKIKLSFKTPDISRQVLSLYNPEDYTPEDAGLLAILREKTEETIKKFVKNDEYVTIEFDTDTGTATVIPV